MLGRIVVELLEAFQAVAGHPLTIVETGTMYQDWLEGDERDLMARSTLAIAHWVREHDDEAAFYSIDSDQEHIATSRRVIAEHGLAGAVDHLYGDGAAVIGRLARTIDFALLDSDSDPRVIAREYGEVIQRIAIPGLIVIDDVFKHSERVNKGRVALPMAQANGLHCVGIRNQVAAIAVGQAAREVLERFPGVHGLENMA